MYQSSRHHNNENINQLNKWTRSQDQAFERALVIFPDSTENRWEKVATLVNGQSPANVREHYQILLHDIDLIESGRVELPNYLDGLVQEPMAKDNESQEKAPSLRSKKGAWTTDEHRLFLRGLKEYGKGDWKSISRYVVVSRTSTQVASHAQKYFQRQNDIEKERKRTSIHDITLEDSDLVSHPIVQQQNGIPPPNVQMRQLQEMQQAQELQQAQEMLQLNPSNNMPHQRSGFVQQPQEMHQLNPPNNRPHQMRSGFVHFNNGFLMKSLLEDA